MKDTIRTQAIELLVGAIFDTERLELGDYGKVIALAEIFSPLPDSVVNQLVDIGLKNTNHKWLTLAVKAAKLGGTPDRRERLIHVGTTDAPFVLNMGLEDILTVAKLGVSAEALTKAADFVWCHSEAYGHEKSWNAMLTIMSLGVPMVHIDDRVRSWVRTYADAKLNLHRMIDLAKTGASLAIREALVKMAIEWGSESNATAAARVAGRELTEAETEELKSKSMTTASS